MHSAPSPRTWLVGFAGFFQTRGTANGMIDLHGELRQKHVSPQTVVQFCHWDDNVDGLAEQIWRTARKADVAPAIYVYAYSWGGMTAMNFARQLRARDNLRVRHMVLSDAVYRHWYWAGNWRAFMPGIPIVVPDNVLRVDWYRQTTTRLRGHDLVAEDDVATNLSDPVYVRHTPHTRMDDCGLFRERCLQVAEMAEAA